MLNVTEGGTTDPQRCDLDLRNAPHKNNELLGTIVFQEDAQHQESSICFRFLWGHTPLKIPK